MPISISSLTHQSYMEKAWDFKSILDLKQLSPDKSQQKMIDLLMDLSCDLSRVMQDLKRLGQYCHYLERLVDRNANATAPQVETYFSRVDCLGGIVSQRDVFEDYVHIVKNPGLRDQKTGQ